VEAVEKEASVVERGSESDRIEYYAGGGRVRSVLQTNDLVRHVKIQRKPERWGPWV
jgi:hypothetical protein